MCHYRSNHEAEVSKYIGHAPPEKSVDPNKQFQCKECWYETDSTNKLEGPMKARHKKQPKPVKCPMCSYENSSGSELTKHVEEQHP